MAEGGEIHCGHRRLGGRPFQGYSSPQGGQLCVYEIVFLENIAKAIPDKDQRIVVYGSGETSLEAQTAAEKLSNAGYRKVHVLQGGLKGWTALGYEVEGENADALEQAAPDAALADGRYALDTD